MTAREISGHQSMLPICCTDLCCLCSTYDVASQHVASSLFVTFVDLVSVVRLLVCSSVALRLFLVFCAVFVGSAPPHTNPHISNLLLSSPPCSDTRIDSLITLILVRRCRVRRRWQKRGQRELGKHIGGKRW